LYRKVELKKKKKKKKKKKMCFEAIGLVYN